MAHKHPAVLLILGGLFALLGAGTVAAKPRVSVAVEVAAKEPLKQRLREVAWSEGDPTPEAYLAKRAAEALERAVPIFDFRASVELSSARHGVLIVLYEPLQAYPWGDVRVRISYFRDGERYYTPFEAFTALTRGTGASSGRLRTDPHSLAEKAWFDDQLREAVARRWSSFQRFLGDIPIKVRARTIHTPQGAGITTNMEYGREAGVYPSTSQPEAVFQVRTRSRLPEFTFVACWPSRVSGPITTLAMGSEPPRCRSTVRAPRSARWRTIYLVRYWQSDEL